MRRRSSALPPRSAEASPNIRSHKASWLLQSNGASLFLVRPASAISTGVRHVAVVEGQDVSVRQPWILARLAGP